VQIINSSYGANCFCDTVSDETLGHEYCSSILFCHSQSFLCIVNMRNNMTCSTPVATPFQQVRNSDINRMVVDSVVDISVIDTQDLSL